jgi:hypothetical protein
MARPERHDADYFPFYAKRGRTLNILQSKFGCEGIGVFTNILRFLTLTPDHHYCIKDETDRMNFFSEIGIQDERGIEIIELMVKTEKLDKELWEKYKVIASEAFLESLADAYKQRKNKIITMSEIREKFVSMYGNSANGNKADVSIHGNPHTAGFPCEISSHNPQRKGKERKLKDSKVNSIGSDEPTDEKPSSKQKQHKPKKLPLRERDPVNDLERVEKVYLQNWDILYSQGKVKTPDPVVNWSQTRKLLKNLFEKLTAEQIIQAVNNGLKDDWVMKKGYSLGVMLSSSMMNSFVNAAPGVSPVSKHQREKINLE